MLCAQSPFCFLRIRTGPMLSASMAFVVEDLYCCYSTFYSFGSAGPLPLLEMPRLANQ